VLFSVENNPLFSTDFSGSYPLSITLNSGDSLTIGPVLCNYMAVGNNVPGDATTFRDCYYNLVDNIFDPKSNVVINGNVQVEPVRPPVGPWFWTINTGDTLTCDLNILAGNVA